MTKKTILHASLIPLVLIVAAGLSASFLHNRPTYMSDTVTYVEGAKSLATGGGYFRGGNPITTWPPGYSLCLSALVRCGLDSFVAFKTLNIAFAVLAVGLLLVLFRRFLSIWEASALALATGAFFPWIYYTHTILADIPFALITTAFVLSITLYCLPSTVHRQRWLAIAAFLCAIAPLIRSAGLALIPALAVLPFLRHLTTKSTTSQSSAYSLRFVVCFRILLPTFYVLLPTIFLLSAWFLRNHLHTGSILGYSVGVTPEYAFSLEKIGITEPNLLTRIWVNLRGYTHIFVIPDQVGIDRVSKLPLVIHIACAGMWLLIAAGWTKRLLNRAAYPLSITFACYAGLLLLNTWYDIRYVLPVLGLCFLFLYDGISLCISAIIRFVTLHPWPFGSQFPFQLSAFSFQVFLRSAFLALLVAGNFAFSALGPQAATLRSSEYEGELQRMYEACVFIREANEAGEVLVAGGGGFVPVWTGRRVSSLLGLVGGDKQLTSLSIPDGVRFLLLDESKFAPYRKQYMEPVVRENRGRLELAYEAGRTRVYRVK